MRRYIVEDDNFSYRVLDLEDDRKEIARFDDLSRAYLCADELEIDWRGG